MTMGVLGRFGARARQAAREAWNVDVSLGPPSGILSRLAYGAILPVAILRAIGRNPELSRAHRRNVFLQLGVISILSLVFLPGSLSGVYSAIDKGGEVVRTKDGMEIRLGKKKKRLDLATTKHGLRLDADVDGDGEVEDDEADEEAPAPLAAPPPEPSHLGQGAQPVAPGELPAGSESRQSTETDPPPSIPTLIALYAGAVWGVLKVLDWLVAAFFQEPNDSITHRVSRQLGATIEEGPSNPRIRFSVRWALKRLKRHFSGGLMMGSAMPIMAAVGFLPWVGSTLQRTLLACWGLYWFAVLTTAKSAAAWNEESFQEPWFLRAWERLTASGILAWWLPRFYGRILRRLAWRLRVPALAFERSPWELAGLTGLRMVASLPVASVFLRSVIPVAAGYLITRKPFVQQPALGEASALPAVAEPAHPLESEVAASSPAARPDSP